MIFILGGIVMFYVSGDIHGDVNKAFCGHWHIDKKIDKMRFIMNDLELIERM